MSRQAGALDVKRLVPERARNRVRVGVQGDADDDRDWAEVAVHELPEMRGIDLLHLQSASAEALRLGLDRDHDVGLPGCSAATLAAGLDTADERLIDLDIARQQIRRGAAHRGAQLVTHPPRGLIRPQPQQRLKRGGADPVLRRYHQPRSLKPHGQRRPRVLEDRAGLDAHPPSAPATRPPARRQAPALLGPAVWAAEAVRPPQPVQIVQARRVVREPRAHRREIAGVVHPSHWRRQKHGTILLPSSGYPIFVI